ncbi:sensor histidine kinase [Beijerinckia mobilis]|uniref:sensor histidine kinase n=1 Tax=Beijerinckia mobilis TaxID=231434 RepID=UPI00146FD0C2|nr:CHASE3 domain-containing protein [Beijerinckia mobilis]
MNDFTSPEAQAKNPENVPAQGMPQQEQTALPAVLDRNSPLSPLTLLLLVIGSLGLLIIVAASFILLNATNHDMNDLSRLRDGAATTNQILTLLQNAESSQRGYLLTQDERYLEPFNATKEQLPEKLRQTHPVYQENPRTKELFTRLVTISQRKMDEMSETIALTKAGKRQEAIEFVKTNSGFYQMENLRTLVGELDTDVNRRVDERFRRQNDNVFALRLVTISSTLVIVLVLAGVFWLILRFTNNIISARRDIEILNDSLEAKVEERTLDLLRANSEIQRFAYIVSHDLRAPLVNVMGFTSELSTNLTTLREFIEKLEKGKDDSLPALLDEAKFVIHEEMPEALQFIRTSTTKMDGLINTILKLSREGRRVLTAEPVDLNHVCEQAVGAIRHQFGEGGEGIMIENRLPVVISDRLALDQIFGNLLDNSIKYRIPARPLHVTIRGKVSGKRVLIEVEDNGRGIAPQDHERIFELFRRSGAQDQPGEGLGLAHVRALLHRLGGDIKVVSTLGQGSIFQITMPLVARKFE